MANTPRRRKVALSIAAGLMVCLPIAAFMLAPSATAQSNAAPGSDLAGIDTSATAAGIQVAPLTPGIVGAGNLTQGNLVEADMPYAASTVSTGPATGGTASPAYPGPTAAGAGTALQTFSPSFPATLVNLLNDHELAESAYPPQLTAGTSGSYTPPGGSAAGVGTASTQSGPAGTTATATLNNTALAGSGLVDVSSSTSTTSATVQAASVATTANAVINGITIVGVIKIAGINSDASASSNGTVGQESGDLRIGAVTVAGFPAYIGPNGIHLVSTDEGVLAVTALNEALAALQQAGLSVTTIAPTSQQSGPSASVTSGAVQIAFIDPNVPNPQGDVPLSSIGIEIDLGLTAASADATGLPPFTPFPSISTPPVTQAVVPPVTVSPGGGSPSSTGVSPAVTNPVPTSATPVPPAIATAAPPAETPSTPLPTVSPASFLGLPVRMAWVVIAVVLSIIAAAPLLGYANWQLLRGRTP